MQCAQDLEHPADWLIRSKHNRTLPQGKKLWNRVLETESIGEIEFEMAERKGQKARLVRQEVFASRVTLRNRRPVACDLPHRQGNQCAERRQTRRVAALDQPSHHDL